MFGTGPSIQLVRLFGIRIGASPSWFVVLFFFIFLMSESFQEQLDGSETEGYLVAVAAVLMFFVSLVLHELGHALVARRLGIGIQGIDLWFFGGVAKMSRDTDSPGTEFKVAAAGPAVTVLVVGACVGALAIGGLTGEEILDALLLYDIPGVTPALALFGFLASINLALFAFNMVPAFPLDGGRIARALVWRLTGDRTRATRAAGRLGQGFAYVLIGFGLFLASTGNLLDGVWLGVLGWFLLQAARGAVVSSAFSERLEGITVADIMDAQPVAIPAELPLTRAQDEYFLRYGWDWFPVVDAQGRFRGLARQAAVDAEVQAGRPALTVGEIVASEDGPALAIPADRPLEALLGDEQLRSSGALMAVDGEGVLRGVVTVEQVRRALAAALPSRLA